MNETETRPTPEEIAGSALEASHCGAWVDGVDLIRNLTMRGYVIVHPDDLPMNDEPDGPADGTYEHGWNACRAHIFGGDDE